MIVLSQNAVARRRVFLLLFAALLCLWNPAEGFAQSVESVVVSRDGKTLVAGGEHTIRFWNLQTKELRSSLMTGYARVESVSLSNDGRLLAINRHLILSLPIDKKQLQQQTGTYRADKWEAADDRWTLSVAFSPDSRLLAVGTEYDNCLLLVDTRTRSERRFAKDRWTVHCVTFSPNGEILLSGSITDFGNSFVLWAGAITLWDVRTGRMLRHIKSGKSVKSVAFSSDGKLFASGGYDYREWEATDQPHSVKLWNAATGTLVREMPGHQGGIETVAFSPDGKLLASGSRDKTVRLWEVATGRLLRTMEGHTGFVNSVTFTPDGKLLISGSKDGAVKLWNPGDGRLLTTLLPPAETGASHENRKPARAFAGSNR